MQAILMFLYQLLFIPHWLLFVNSKNKALIMEDLYNQSPKKNSTFAIWLDFTKLLAENKYFRTLFYFRARGTTSKILRIFYPMDERLTIDINTKLGGGVILAHPYSSIINAKEIGKKLYINQLVTIGESNGLLPTIGDNVKLYTNCTVLGDITIGNNVVIGAGAVVVKSIPDNCVVVGNPARIIKQNS
jgi:serine O-acetyltransferase